jgi:hypothetical protein
LWVIASLTDRLLVVPVFCPGESDTTLQNGDQWFYDAKGGIRTLAELQV